MSKFTDEIMRLAQTWVDAERLFASSLPTSNVAKLAGAADAAKTALRDYAEANGPEDEDEPTFKIVRKFKDHNKDDEFIKGGLTREEAKEHCSDDDSSGDGWFDVFYEE